MNDAIVLLASAGAVAAMTGVAAALGFRVTGRFADADAVRAAVRAVDPDAVVTDVAVDRGIAAARLADGRWAVARALGDSATARIVSPAAARPRIRSVKGGVLVLTPGLDLGFPAGALRLSQTPDWLATLARAPQDA